MERTIGCSMAPTLECNLSCKHCYEADKRSLKKRELTLEEFDQLAEKLEGQGMKLCTLTDGEPLISRASREKCESAVKNFWITYIVTNGTQEFIDIPVSYIMSLDGPQKVHDSIRGKGVFDQLSQQQRDSIEAIVMDMWDPFIKAVKKKYLKLKSSLICSMWSPNLTGSSIRCETANIARPLKKTRRFLKAPNTCCLKTVKIFDLKPSVSNSSSCFN